MHAAYKAGTTPEEILEVLNLVGDWTGVPPSWLAWRPSGRHAALICPLWIGWSSCGEVQGLAVPCLGPRARGGQLSNRPSGGVLPATL
jgi:hypothetical protein